jgi:hypothetical protein
VLKVNIFLNKIKNMMMKASYKSHFYKIRVENLILEIIKRKYKVWRKIANKVNQGL